MVNGLSALIACFTALVLPVRNRTYNIVVGCLHSGRWLISVCGNGSAKEM